MRAFLRTLTSLLAVTSLGLSVADTVLAAGRPAAGQGPSIAPVRPPSRGSSGDPDVVGEILVKLRTANALTPLLTKYSLTLVDRFGSRPIFRLRVIGNASTKDIIANLLLEPDVMLAETNATQRSPEARYNVPWVIGNAVDFAAQWAPQAMHLAQAQQLSTGAGVRVAVLDTGVDASHPLLAGRLLPGFDFVDFDTDPSEVGSTAYPSYGHGTHVAGLVAMVAPGAQIMPIRVLDANGAGNAWVLSEALLYAIDPDGNPATNDGAQVINMSLGSLQRTRLMAAISAIASCEPEVADDPVLDRSDPGYADDAARCAAGGGVVVIAAAGNDSSGNTKEYPAAEGAYGLLAVGASTSQFKLAGFTNTGSWIGLAAPGEAITSSLPGGGYGTWSGTSMASPLAAGTAALVWSANPTMTAKDVVRRLTRASGMLCGTNLRQVDAAAAVTNVVPPNIACN